MFIIITHLFILDIFLFISIFVAQEFLFVGNGVVDETIKGNSSVKVGNNDECPCWKKMIFSCVMLELTIT